MARDVVDLIMDDHRELERMFEELRSRPDRRAMLLPRVSSLLIAHSRAEEAEVYTVARDEAGEEDEVEHGQEEHLQAEQLLEQLQSMDPEGADFDSALGEFIHAVTHHIEEEEESVLPGLRERLSPERRDEVAEAFVATRADHLGAEAGDLTRDELDIQAENLGLEGTSSKSKDELKRELEDHAADE